MDQFNTSQKVKLLATGLTGLVGSRIVELLSDRYDFEPLHRDLGINILDKKQILDTVAASRARFLLHLAAKTDVEACERDKHKGVDSEAWQVNVEATKNIVEACVATDKKIIYISTDFVFDGEQGPYEEDDKPNPNNFYAQTKYEGEKIVQNSTNEFMICRIAYPYRSVYAKKLDVVRLFIDKMKKNESINFVYDQLIIPTFIDDIAYGIKILIEGNHTGIYHVVGSEAITPYELGLKIAQTFNLTFNGKKMKLSDYYANCAYRPYKSVLKNDKMKDLGARLCTVSEGLFLIKL